MTDESQGKVRPAATLSNLGLLVAVVLAIAWPVTGDRALGVAALGMFLLAVAFAGINVAERVRRGRVPVAPAPSCGGSCAGCAAVCATPASVTSEAGSASVTSEAGSASVTSAATP